MRFFEFNFNRFNTKFSPQTKELISESRQTAIRMGYDYISSLHFFIADCQMNQEFSIKKFVFNDNEAFEIFYKRHTIGEILFLGDQGIRLTSEAEWILKYSIAERVCYRDKYVQPYHIFLAAMKYEKSRLASIFKTKDQLSQRLETYYINIGQLQKEKIKKGVSYTISKIWVKHRN